MNYDKRMTAVPAEPLDLRRTRLLDRVLRLRPKLLVLLAPAGYGKSTLARQLPGDAGPIAVCDCREVRDDLDLARRLIETLRVLRAGTPAAFVDGEAILHDGALSVAERLNLALEKWREPVSGTVVFENAEHFASVPIAREFFARLFANRPPERRLVVCTREPFRISLTRYAAPHEILVLRAPDLAFDDDELRAIFAGAIDDAESLARIKHVSLGWPIAVLLLRRFASEGRVAMLLDSLDDVAFAELHDYLQDQVVSAIDAGMRDALFVCAATPHATEADLRAAQMAEEQIEDLTERARQSPFVSRNGDGEFIVNPLLASLLLEHQAGRRTALLRSLAAQRERDKDFCRAAELLLASGDQTGAARALAQHQVLRDGTAPDAYGRVLSALDPVLVQRYPRLWSMTAIARIFIVKSEALLDEAESLWRTLSSTKPAETYLIFVLRVLLMSYLGLFEQAIVMLNEFMLEMQASDALNELFGAYLVYVRGLLQARTGRLAEGERALHSALPFIEEMDIMASGTFLSLGADVARVRGERAIERQFIERALERGRRSRMPNFIAFDYAEAFAGAWFAGETELSAEYAAKLDDVVTKHGIRGFSYLSAIARGRRAQPSDSDLATYVTFGALVSLGSTPDEANRAHAAHLALRSAQRTHRPFLIAISAIAVALVDSGKRDEFLALAQNAAARCESPALNEALSAVASGVGDAGMLGAFVRYLTDEHRNIVPPITVRFTGAAIEVDGRPAALSGRELELVLALGLRRDATPRSRLASMLWPDLDTPAALNALSVCLHRARGHLGRRDVIVKQEDGYALHPDASVDLWDIERIAGAVRTREILSDAQRDALRRIWNMLREARPAAAENWEWFEPVERRLRELRTELAHRLAHDALRRGQTEFALTVASDLITVDACDETARELAIRAHLQEGDRAAAMRQYRAYRETLQAELQVEPSRALTELVMQ